MFKVFIIDDETLVRIGLKSMINWQEQDCVIIGEASNGEMGYNIIKKERPDIVITDLKMPVIDGIEMMEKVLKEDKKIKFIVLSGYDDYHLVRQAMKSGAEDYLIKLELEPEALIKILSKVKEKIILETKNQDEKSRIEEHLKANKQSLRESFFKKIISNVLINDFKIKEEAEYLDVNLDLKNFLCCIVRIDDTGKLQKTDEENINLLEFSVVNIIDEIVNDFFKGYTLNWNFRDYAIIFDTQIGFDKELIKTKIEDMVDRIKKMLKQYFNISVSVGISNIHDSFKDIRTAFIEANQSIDNSFYSHNNKAVFYSDIVLPKCTDTNCEINKIINNLSKYIETADIDAIEVYFDDIILKIHNNKLDKKIMYDICGKISYIISLSIEKYEGNLEDIDDNNILSIENILRLKSVGDIEEWLKEVERKLCIFLLKKDTVQNNKIISMAKKYIIKNLANQIKLQDVANSINISSGYLSTIFKQYAGMNFTDYITEVRIEEAKKLLKESNYKMYEISEKTGYENAYYFSKVFKKVTGMTPSEFMNKAISKNYKDH